jgi:broad specificity phosphatase PhoE
MAHFYGTVHGARGEASRLGHKSTGMTTICASHAGAVRCIAYVCNGVDYVRVHLTLWQGNGVELTIYEGPIGGPVSEGYLRMVDA